MGHMKEKMFLSIKYNIQHFQWLLFCFWYIGRNILGNILGMNLWGESTEHLQIGHSPKIICPAKDISLHTDFAKFVII